VADQPVQGRFEPAKIKHNIAMLYDLSLRLDGETGSVNSQCR